MQKTYLLTKDEVILYTEKGEKKFSLYTQKGCILEVMIKNINKDLKTKEITYPAAESYRIRTSKEFAEITGRGVRHLNQSGYIVSVSKGIFKFTGRYTDSRSTPFPKNIRDLIIKRDNYTCQNCGITEKEGGLLTADHIIPQYRNGQPTLENGMCLCTKCENIKSNYSVKTFGLKMYKKFLKISVKQKDTQNEKFFRELIDVFEKNNRT